MNIDGVKEAFDFDVIKKCVLITKEKSNTLHFEPNTEIKEVLIEAIFKIFSDNKQEIFEKIGNGNYTINKENLIKKMTEQKNENSQERKEIQMEIKFKNISNKNKLFEKFCFLNSDPDQNKKILKELQKIIKEKICEYYSNKYLKENIKKERERLPFKEFAEILKNEILEFEVEDLKYINFQKKYFGLKNYNESLKKNIFPYFAKNNNLPNTFEEVLKKMKHNHSLLQQFFTELKTKAPQLEQEIANIKNELNMISQNDDIKNSENSFDEKSFLPYQEINLSESDKKVSRSSLFFINNTIVYDSEKTFESHLKKNFSLENFSNVSNKNFNTVKNLQIKNLNLEEENQQLLQKVNLLKKIEIDSKNQLIWKLKKIKSFLKVTKKFFNSLSEISFKSKIKKIFENKKIQQEKKNCEKCGENDKKLNLVLNEKNLLSKKNSKLLEELMIFDSKQKELKRLNSESSIINEQYEKLIIEKNELEIKNKILTQKLELMKNNEKEDFYEEDSLKEKIEERVEEKIEVEIEREKPKNPQPFMKLDKFAKLNKNYNPPTTNTEYYSYNRNLQMSKTLEAVSEEERSSLHQSQESSLNYRNSYHDFLERRKVSKKQKIIFAIKTNYKFNYNWPGIFYFMKKNQFQRDKSLSKSKKNIFDKNKILKNILDYQLSESNLKSNKMSISNISNFEDHPKNDNSRIEKRIHLLIKKVKNLDFFINWKKKKISQLSDILKNLFCFIKKNIVYHENKKYIILEKQFNPLNNDNKKAITKSCNVLKIDNLSKSINLLNSQNISPFDKEEPENVSKSMINFYKEKNFSLDNNNFHNDFEITNLKSKKANLKMEDNIERKNYTLILKQFLDKEKDELKEIFFNFLLKVFPFFEMEFQNKKNILPKDYLKIILDIVQNKIVNNNNHFETFEKSELIVDEIENDPKRRNSQNIDDDGFIKKENYNFIQKVFKNLFENIFGLISNNKLNIKKIKKILVEKRNKSSTTNLLHFLENANSSIKSLKEIFTFVDENLKNYLKEYPKKNIEKNDTKREKKFFKTLNDFENVCQLFNTNQKVNFHRNIPILKNNNSAPNLGNKKESLNKNNLKNKIKKFLNNNNVKIPDKLIIKSDENLMEYFCNQQKNSSVENNSDSENMEEFSDEKDYEDTTKDINMFKEEFNHLNNKKNNNYGNFHENNHLNSEEEEEEEVEINYSTNGNHKNFNNNQSENENEENIYSDDSLSNYNKEKFSERNNQFFSKDEEIYNHNKRNKEQSDYNNENYQERDIFVKNSKQNLDSYNQNENLNSKSSDQEDDGYEEENDSEDEEQILFEIDNSEKNKKYVKEGGDSYVPFVNKNLKHKETNSISNHSINWEYFIKKMKNFINIFEKQKNNEKLNNLIKELKLAVFIAEKEEDQFISPEEQKNLTINMKNYLNKEKIFYHDNNKENEEIKKNLIEKENQIIFLKDRISVLEQTLDVKSHQLENMTKSFYDNQDQKKYSKDKSLKSKLKDYVKKIKHLKEKILNQEQEIEKSHITINEVLKKNSQLEKEYTNLQENLALFDSGKKKIKDLKTKIKDLETLLEQYKNEYVLLDRNSKKKITKYKKEILKLKKENKQLKSYYADPNLRLSMKKKADFILLENMIRQKELYIQTLQLKIRENKHHSHLVNKSHYDITKNKKSNNISYAE